MAFAREHSKSWLPAQASFSIRGSLCKQQAFLCSALLVAQKIARVWPILAFLTLTSTADKHKDKTNLKAPAPAPIRCADF